VRSQFGAWFYFHDVNLGLHGLSVTFTHPAAPFRCQTTLLAAAANNDRTLRLNGDGWESRVYCVDL
jgi:hypothetical protein